MISLVGGMNVLLDPIEMLNDLANDCTRAEDHAYWILMSAAARLNGSVEVYE